MQEAIAESIDTLTPWMPWADHFPTAEEAKENCSRAAQSFREGKDFRLHLFLKNSGVFVGGSGLHRFDWSITKFALEKLGPRRIEIRCSALNVKSSRVPEKLGLTLEGILRNHSRHTDGSLEDKRVYSKIVS